MFQVEFLYEQDFYALREDCLRRDVLFEDPEFPVDNDLLRARTKRVEDDVEWMRQLGALLNLVGLSDSPAAFPQVWSLLSFIVSCQPKT